MNRSGGQNLPCRSAVEGRPLLLPLAKNRCAKYDGASELSASKATCDYLHWLQQDVVCTKVTTLEGRLPLYLEHYQSCVLAEETSLQKTRHKTEEYLSHLREPHCNACHWLVALQPYFPPTSGSLHYGIFLG